MRISGLSIVAVAALLGIFLTSCSAHSKTTPSLSQNVRTQSHKTQSVHGPGLGLVSNGGTMSSFSEVVGWELRPEDYDKFVDRSVVGADRQLAVKFLKMMPKSMRGDFSYIEPKTGKILSNRIDLVAKIKLKASSALLQAHERGAMSQRSLKSYPPQFGGGGAFIRDYSYQGFNGMSGYATPPCPPDIIVRSVDEGDMYFNAYSSNSSGSVVDGGLTQNRNGNPNVVTPFIQLYTGPLYTGWTDENYSWACGTHLGIMFGTSADGSFMMLTIGVPEYDPTQYQLPPTSTNWHHGAWNFFPTPDAMRSGAISGTSQGIPSPCTGCYVARMFTIAESGGGLHGDCYGACVNPNNPTGRWDQVVGGNLISPCSQTPNVSTTCTIEYLSSGSWMQGSWDSVDQLDVGYVVWYRPNDQNALLGLNDGFTTGKSQVSLPNAFLFPLPPAPPPSCTPDSYGYCVQTITRNTTVLNCLDSSGALVKELVGSITYGINDGASYTDYFADDGSGSCSTIEWWDPGEPSQVYRDPNLP